MTMLENSLLSLSQHGFHHIHYTEWRPPPGAQNGQPPKILICVHGLTRNGRDFDFLAQALSQQTGYTVICPDVAGRGRSDWLPQGEDYSYPQYLADMTALIARSGAAQVDWLGTSMGGLIGMLLASRPNSPIRKLIVNDVGPFLPKAALERIGSYLSRPLRFATLEQMEDYVRVIAAPFGNLSDAQWRHLTQYSARPLDNGYAFAYDPAIAEAFKAPLEDVDLWPVWQQVRCPTLVLRGAQSDLLLREDAERMTHSGPHATLIEFADAGHAPALMAAEQISAVRDWLQP